MSSKQINKAPSGEHLHLPEPDPDNITVLTRNLPNKPILPWHHYDSPWRDGEEENQEQSEVAELVGECSEESVIAAFKEAADNPEQLTISRRVEEPPEELATIEVEEVEETENLEKSTTIEQVNECPEEGFDEEFDEEFIDALVEEAESPEQLEIAEPADEICEEELAATAAQESVHADEELRQLG